MTNNARTTETVAIRATPDRVRDMLSKMSAEMRAAIPTALPPERLARLALTELRRTPKLQECSPASFIGAVMQAAQLGLEIGTVGHVALIPYRSECQIQIMYRGLIALAMRSGAISNVSAWVVHQDDRFEVQLGSDARIVHVPIIGSTAPVIAAYAIARLRDGSTQFDVMGREEIERIRRMSPSKDAPAWREHWNEMAKKTVMKRLLKYLPVSTETLSAITIDDESEIGAQQRGEITIPADAMPTRSDALADIIAQPPSSDESSATTTKEEEPGDGTH